MMNVYLIELLTGDKLFLSGDNIGINSLGIEITKKGKFVAFIPMGTIKDIKVTDEDDKER